jgi:NAD(P) transhydrogenase subunit beta
MTTPTWAQVAYLVGAVCFILALRGLASPRTARVGNLIGAAGAVLAVIVVLIAGDLDHMGWILGAILVGVVIGVPVARQVQMTAMPQLVALFNGVGGGAAAIVAVLELNEAGDALGGLDTDPGGFPVVASILTLMIGAISFSGSMVTFAKLQELMTSRPVIFPGGPAVFGLLVAATVGTGVYVEIANGTGAGPTWGVLGVAIFALAVGVFFVLPVGGADVPIVISLLNAFTGLAVAAGGYVLDNTLLLVAGTLVGASGTILTRLMAAAMGRSIANILFGAFRGGSTAGSTVESDRPVRSASAEDVAILLGYARKVIVVPGYGLAVAQAQHVMQELAELLQARGIDLVYAIHPVAGRMPGHMNVLMAEANVPYEALKEMESVNGEFAQTDVALVVGANDVVNPAAKTSPGSPIYGMPILEVEQAKAVIFLKRSMRPGFAGIENELLYDPKTTLLFGDAKASLTDLVAAVKRL